MSTIRRPVVIVATGLLAAGWLLQGIGQEPPRRRYLPDVGREHRQQPAPDVDGAGPDERFSHSRGRQWHEAVLGADAVRQKRDRDEVDRLQQRLEFMVVGNKHVIGAKPGIDEAS